MTCIMADKKQAYIEGTSISQVIDTAKNFAGRDRKKGKKGQMVPKKDIFSKKGKSAQKKEKKRKKRKRGTPVTT